MTISKQSFGGSNLDVFIKSNLNVRGDDEGFIWFGERGDGADNDSVVYELDPGDFSVVRLAHLSPGFQIEGCGGKADVLYINHWKTTAPTSESIGEYPVDAESWAEENWPLTPDRSTSDWIGPDGIGGDTETLWVSFVDAIWEMDPTDWSYIRHTNPVYTRCDAVGGSSTVCWCTQYEAGDPPEDHRMQLDVDDLTNELQDVPVMFPGSDNYVHEGIGGSEERVWACKTYWGEYPSAGMVFQADPSDLRATQDINWAFAPGDDARGIGGS